MVPSARPSSSVITRPRPSSQWIEPSGQIERCRSTYGPGRPWRPRPGRCTRPGRRGAATPPSRRRCRRSVPGAMPCIASSRASQTVRPVSSSQYQVPSCAASSASCRCSCSSRSSTTLRSLACRVGRGALPARMRPHCHGRRWPLPTMRRAVYWCGDRTCSPSTVPRMVALVAPLTRSRARARPARQRRHAGGQGDRRRARPARDELAARRRRTRRGAYSRLDPDGPAPLPRDARHPASAPTRVTLDRAVDTIRAARTPASAPGPSGRCGGRWSRATRRGCT